jgi:putative oxidoreductase
MSQAGRFVRHRIGREAFENNNAMSNNPTPGTTRATEITYFLMRIVAGLLFIQFGGLILFGWFGGMPGQPGRPPLLSQTGIGGILEFFGGIAISLGLATRPVAFVLSGMMAVAYWQFHAPTNKWPVVNQGVPAILFCFLYLHMAARGAGCWSLDRYFCGKKTNQKEIQ